MSLQTRLLGVGFAVGMAFLLGCETFDEDPMAHMDFKSRAVVEDMNDDDISVNGADSMAAMKKERKLQIAVSVEISNQSTWKENVQGADVRMRTKETEDKLITSADAFARAYLQGVKGYRMVAVDTSDFNRTLKTGADINGIVYPFLCRLKVIMTSEQLSKLDYDLLVYKCVVQWELIDNRTKTNGLGENLTPVVMESMTCQNVTWRKRPLSVTGSDKNWNSVWQNAQNAYNEVIGNCMSQFYAQLANRVPFGGVASGLKVLDGDMYVSIKADAKGQGVVKKMQMLITNDDNDRIAVGEVLVSANGKSNIKIWRWLSKSYRKQMEAVASKGREDVENWLDENPLYALCLGLPEAPKDMMLDFRSRK